MWNEKRERERHEKLFKKCRHDDDDDHERKKSERLKVGKRSFNTFTSQYIKQFEE